MLFRNTSIALLLSLNVTGQSVMSSFELIGHAKGAKNGSVIYLEPVFGKNNYYKFKCDSAIIFREKFRFKGKLKGPLGVRLIYRDNETFARSEMVFIEKGKLNTKFFVDSLMNNIVPIMNSKTQQEYQNSVLKVVQKYNNLYAAWEKQTQNLYDNLEGRKLDSALSEMRIQNRKITTNYHTEIANFVLRNSHSIPSVFLMLDVMNGYDEIFYEALLHFSSKIKNSEPYQLLYKKILNSKSLSIGEYFPKLNLVNLHNNKPESLSTYSYKKFTFIDFWFAKCGACIRQFPAYRNINSTSDTTFFNLISITIDPEKEINNAINIIKTQKANWVQLWDKDGKNSFSFNIYNYPTNFLLDSTGRIIAKNIEPLELNRFLRTYHK